MDKLLLYIFFISLALVLHTYLLYPVLMITLFKTRRKEQASYSMRDELPALAVLIAAYNEEKVIGEKIESVFNTNYPLSKLKVYVGSDASFDKTDEIIETLRKKYPQLELVKFSGRSGKINVVNHLQSLGDEDVLVMTDANVMFKPETLYELVKYFKNTEVGIVAANIVKQSRNNIGISHQEKVYLSLENTVKTAESNAFDLVMGAEGGCYAIRNSLFSKVPSRFNVDDFYITLQVILKGKKVLFNPLALCTEDVPGEVEGEYRRKVRISSGNFQNLFFFRALLLRFWKPLGFMFWSHKVLRWLTPFLLIIMFLCSAVLAFNSRVFLVLSVIQLCGMLFPLLQKLINSENSLFKFISHFYLMNLALLEGFVKFIRGIQSSIWQPVKRDV